MSRTYDNLTFGISDRTGTSVRLTAFPVIGDVHKSCHLFRTKLVRKIDISTPTHPNVFTLVDDKDFEFLSQWKWCASKVRNTSYVVRTVWVNEKSKNIGMHRVIMSAPDNMDVDHRDGNGLNNQQGNLRVCTRSQNLYNQKLARNNTSGYKGVYWDKDRSRWVSQIKANGRRHKLGRYFCLIKAAKAYDTAARKYHGEYANTNFKEK